MNSFDFWLDWNVAMFRSAGLTVRPVHDSMIGIVTNTPSDVSSTSATLSGRIIGMTSSTKLISVDMVYGMLDDIAAQKRVSSDIKKDGTFSVSLTGLKTGTAYYYYTYVGVDSLYIYGNINTFTTLDDTPTPGETVDLGRGH